MRVIGHEDMRGQHRCQGLAIAQTFRELAFAVQGIGPVLALSGVFRQGETDLSSEVAQLILGFTQVAPASVCVQRA